MANKSEEKLLHTFSNIVKEFLDIDDKEAGLIVNKAIEGSEINNFNFDQWLKRRFLPNLVFIDEDGSSKMCVDALKIMKGTAATDYGSSRQRDMGQMWADMTRGYLGELAFLLLLKERWKIKADLGHEIGTMEEYLPMDIHQIQKPGDNIRPPKLKLGIKTTKWN